MENNAYLKKVRGDDWRLVSLVLYDKIPFKQLFTCIMDKLFLNYSCHFVEMLLLQQLL